MIKLIILPILFFITFQVHAQNADYAFEGLINTELKVRIRFNLNEGNANGYCIYVDSKDKKQLTGSLSENGTLVLNQKDGERFEGKVIANYMYKGEFFNAENIDQGTFMFTKIDTPEEEDEQLILASESPKENKIQLDSTLSDGAVTDLLRRYIKEYESCYSKGIDPMKCRQYTAKAITEVFKIDDFKDPYVGGNFLTMTESYDKMSVDTDWKMLGDASQPEVLKEAIKLANEGELVIMAYAFKGFIQLSFIRKGEGHYSSKWGTKVPDVTVFFNNDPAKSSERKALSYLWRSGENLEIWVKK